MLISDVKRERCNVSRGSNEGSPDGMSRTDEGQLDILANGQSLPVLSMDLIVFLSIFFWRFLVYYGIIIIIVLSRLTDGVLAPMEDNANSFQIKDTY